jgi:Na+/H+-dicarboxylate symporter
MPMSINTAIARLRVPPSTANIVVPLGATVNMAGTALYQSAAVVFLAQLSDIDLSGPQIATIVFTLVVSSIGAPGTPGVSIAILSSVVAGFGIPAAGIALILGVDRLLDMARTTVNVAGDLTACVLLRTVDPTPGLRGAPPGQPLPAEAA